MTNHRLNAGPIPLYHQLSQILREAIQQGVYQPGGRLPSEPELIREYGVSRITVRQAFDELEGEELIIRRHGKGTYVAEPRIEQELLQLTDFVEDMQHAGLQPSSRVLAFVHEAVPPLVASALHLPTGMEVVRIDRVRLADEYPIAYDITWLPLRFGELLVGRDLTKETVYQILEQRYGIPVLSGTFTITAAQATEQQATILERKPGAPLLVMQRLSSTTKDEPVYFQERYYRPDRVQYRVSLHRYPNTAGGSQIDRFHAIFDEQGLVANP